MTRPLKALVISQVFPYPPFDGNVLPIYHFLRCLAPRVDYTLLTLRPENEKEWEDGRRVFEGWGIKVVGIRGAKRGKLGQGWACLRAGRWWANRFFAPELAKAARATLSGEAWDVVHAEGILSAQHTPEHLPCGGVLIARDCLSLAHWRSWRHYRKPKDLLQWVKIRTMERDLYRRFGRVLAISPTDQAEMRRIAPGAWVQLLPNGVDLAAFTPEPGREEDGAVVFTGAMDYPPNVDAAVYFCRQVWPLICQRRPEARFYIVGRDPVPAVRALAETAAGSVIVTGRVERIQDMMARAAVIVSPLRHGTGMKNKVLEGAAMGKAMVVSPVSLEDIELTAGQALRVAATAGEMAEQVVGLLGNAADRQRMGETARQAVETKYAWEVMAEKLWVCYREIAGRK